MNNSMNNDMISRQKALDELEQLDGMDGIPKHFMITRKSVRNMLKALPPEQPKWTPCSVEQPKETGLYMVTVQYDNGDNDVDIYEYDAYRKEWNDGDLYSGEVMAWQAKPKPWEGSK